METQDIVDAIVAQRDSAMNSLAQAQAALAAAQRENAAKERRIAELEKQLGNATPAPVEPLS